MKLHGGTLLAVLLALVGCQPSSPELFDLDEAAAVLSAVGMSSTSVHSSAGCSRQRSEPSTVLVVVNADVCLGCLSVGWFVREVERETEERVAIVTRVQDEPTTCEFVRRERIVGPVITVADSALTAIANLSVPLIISLSESGHLRHAWVNNDLRAVLDSLGHRAQKPLPGGIP